MRKQSHAAARERRAQFWLGDEPVDSEFHDWIRWGKLKRKAMGMMEIRPSRRTLQRPVGYRAMRFFDHGRETEMPEGFVREMRPLEVEGGL